MLVARQTDRTALERRSFARDHDRQRRYLAQRGQERRGGAARLPLTIATQATSARAFSARRNETSVSKPSQEAPMPTIGWLAFAARPTASEVLVGVAGARPGTSAVTARGLAVSATSPPPDRS
jgi:hypothetical protein